MRDFKKKSGLTKITHINPKYLQNHINFPKRWTFRIGQSNKTSNCIYPNEYRRRCRQRNQKEFARFIHIASGSASEVEYQLLLARELDYISREEYSSLKKDIIEIKPMLYGFGKNWRLKSKVCRTYAVGLHIPVFEVIHPCIWGWVALIWLEVRKS